jgi:hypothetical protein
MRIKLAIIIPAILTLVTGVSIAAGSTASLAAAHASTTHSVAASPDYWYQG